MNCFDYKRGGGAEREIEREGGKKLSVKHSQTKSCCDKENSKKKKKETAAPSLSLSGLMKNENLFYSNHSPHTCAFAQKKRNVPALQVKRQEQKRRMKGK